MSQTRTEREGEGVESVGESWSWVFGSGGGELVGAGGGVGGYSGDVGGGE